MGTLFSTAFFIIAATIGFSEDLSFWWLLPNSLIWVVVYMIERYPMFHAAVNERGVLSAFGEFIFMQIVTGIIIGSLAHLVGLIISMVYLFIVN